jgi:hypothetical protein
VALLAPLPWLTEDAAAECEGPGGARDAASDAAVATDATEEAAVTEAAAAAAAARVPAWFGDAAIREPVPRRCDGATVLGDVRHPLTHCSPFAGVPAPPCSSR